MAEGYRTPNRLIHSMNLWTSGAFHVRCSKSQELVRNQARPERLIFGVLACVGKHATERVDLVFLGEKLTVGELGIMRGHHQRLMPEQLAERF